VAALALLTLLAFAASAEAQGPPTPTGQDRPPPVLPPGLEADQIPGAGGDTVAVTGQPGVDRFIFEREVFTYPAAGRRDPFLVLSAATGMGPTFDELRLLSTTVVPADPGRSMAEIRDAAGNVYRVRRGSVLGNVTILDISRGAVVVGVDEFGVRRQEQLRMNPPRSGGTER
jgi:hypothetical protein